VDAAKPSRLLKTVADRPRTALNGRSLPAAIRLLCKSCGGHAPPLKSRATLNRVVSRSAASVIERSATLLWKTWR